MRIAIALFVMIAGCTKQNPQACCTDAVDCMNVGLPEGTTCDDGLLCRGNRCVEEPCTSAGQCDITAPYCVMSDEGRCSESCTADSQCPGFSQAASDTYCVSGACAQCRGDEDCPAESTICSDGHCVACVTHADCGSGVCADGACARDAEIAYVATNGATASDCTQASPCNTIDRAQSVMPSRKYIVLESGTYSTTNGIALTGVRWVIGRGPSRPVLTRSTPGPIVLVTGSVDVKLERVEVFGATNGSTSAERGAGVQCTSPGAVKLELLDVVARMNAYAGFYGDTCTATVTSSLFADNLEYGINNGGGSSSFDRCTVVGNGFTGVFVDSGLHVITNSIIVRNGGWGIDLYSTTSGNRVEFNTVVDNGVGTLYGGVMCNLVGITATWPNNLVARNGAPQTTGPCSFTNSLIVDSDIAPLKFVRPDSPPYDYHIQSGSSAIDLAGASATIKTDIDGESRPFGAANDIGADELH